MATIGRLIFILVFVVLGGGMVEYFAPAGIKIYLFALVGFLALVLLLFQFASSGTSDDPVVLEIGGYKWTARRLTHFLISGETGSGKTTSGFNNLFKQVNKSFNKKNGILKKCGGLIIETKGDEGEAYGGILAKLGRKDDLIRISVNDDIFKNPDFARMNLIGDLRFSWATHAKILLDVFASVHGKDGNSFFSAKAAGLLAKIFEMMELKGQIPTIAKAYDLVTSSADLADFIRIDEDELRIYPKDSQEKIFALARQIDAELVAVKADGQKEGILGTLQNLLGNFTDNKFRAVFCSETPNVRITDVDLGKWLSVQISQAFSHERNFIFTYIKLLFYQHGLLRLDKAESIQSKNFLFACLDEFQNVVTKAENGLADHNAIDKLRQPKMFLWIGVQAHQSMDGKVDAINREIIVLNCPSRLHFRAPTEKAAEECSKGIGRIKKDKLSRTKKGFFSGTESRTMTEDRDYAVRPETIMRLKNHEAVIVAPSKDWTIKKLPRIDAFGNEF